MPTPPTEKPTARDVRVDRIGFAAELDKHYVEPLRDAVKAAHPNGVLLAGDFFTAEITEPATNTFPADAWFKLFNDNAITRKQFLAGIRVSTEDARRVLSEKDFDQHVITGIASRRLTVRRKPGVVVDLVRAVKEINDQVVVTTELVDPKPKLAA